MKLYNFDVTLKLTKMATMFEFRNFKIDVHCISLQSRHTKLASLLRPTATQDAVYSRHGRSGQWGRSEDAEGRSKDQ